MSWNDQNIEQLKSLWVQGLSASQIARALGWGFTRNAVIGKIHRMGLTDHGPTALQRRSTVLTPKDRVIKKFRIAAPLPPPVDEPAPLLEPDIFADNGQCKWIHGEPTTGWRMCGHPAHKIGSPWCLFHYARCYEPAKTKASAEKRAAREADAAQTRMARRVGLG